MTISLRIVYNDGSSNAHFMGVKAFDRYRFDKMPEQDEDGVIVYYYLMEKELLDKGYQVIHADNCYGVAYK